MVLRSFALATPLVPNSRSTSCLSFLFLCLLSLVQWYNYYISAALQGAQKLHNRLHAHNIFFASYEVFGVVLLGSSAVMGLRRWLSRVSGGMAGWWVGGHVSSLARQALFFPCVCSPDLLPTAA
jgi:hypothetical protein